MSAYLTHVGAVIQMLLLTVAMVVSAEQDGGARAECRAVSCGASNTVVMACCYREVIAYVQSSQQADGWHTGSDVQPQSLHHTV